MVTPSAGVYGSGRTAALKRQPSKRHYRTPSLLANLKGNRVQNIYNRIPWVFIALITIMLSGKPGLSQQSTPPENVLAAKPVLTEAVMCEDIQQYAPVNRAVVFATDIGQVVCFTAFENVPTQMFIYHSWFRSDKLITSKRLILNPPEWGTFSKILLRQADIGPWRVEVHDQDGKIIKTLRFSITE